MNSLFHWKPTVHIHVHVLFILPRVLISKSNDVHNVHAETKRKLGCFFFHNRTPKKGMNFCFCLWISIRHYLTGFSHYHVSWIFTADTFQMGPLSLSPAFSPSISYPLFMWNAFLTWLYGTQHTTHTKNHYSFMGINWSEIKQQLCGTKKSP